MCHVLAPFDLGSNAIWETKPCHTSTFLGPPKSTRLHKTTLGSLVTHIGWAHHYETQISIVTHDNQQTKLSTTTHRSRCLPTLTYGKKGIPHFQSLSNLFNQEQDLFIITRPHIAFSKP